jgi:hypothetical protein
MYISVTYISEHPNYPKNHFLSCEKSYFEHLCLFEGKLQQWGILLDFFFLCTILHTASSADPQIPSDYIMSEDAGIEPRTGATSALAVKRSNHSARSHPLK